jgi:hypothetical protein
MTGQTAEGCDMASAFKWRHFAGEMILWGVRWYCKYGISYRELEEMLAASLASCLLPRTNCLLIRVLVSSLVNF